MRLIKLALLSFFFLFLLVTGISLLLPSHIRISKALRINAPKDSVISRISDPLQWKNWYPGTDTLAIFYLNGKAAGIILNKASQRYLSIVTVNDTMVGAEYFGIRQKKATTGWNLITESGDHAVTVQWYMDFRLRWYPWEKFSSLLFEKQYGPQMEQGLNNLRQLAEK